MSSKTEGMRLSIQLSDLSHKKCELKKTGYISLNLRMRLSITLEDQFLSNWSKIVSNLSIPHNISHQKLLFWP